MTAAPVLALWDFDAIGTRWQVQTDADLPADLRAAVGTLVDGFDREWSRFRADSVVSALARGAGALAAPPDARAMLDAYVDLDEATGGAVNPLVGAALSRRGYDADYSLIDHGAGAAPADWQDRLSWADQTLALSAPAMIDVGALGKGRLVDRVADLIASRAPGGAVVDASGDVAVRGVSEWIGLEHPYDPSRAIGRWRVSGASLCASAVNRRAWGDGLHHVLDARTGQPVRTVAATWAKGATTMIADAVATALFFDGGPELARAWDVSWVRMTTDGRVEWSPGCDAELFIGR